ncbi:MAG: hypothetical protein KTV72_00155 [Wolbachia endosymbiont of Melophagus ovinus]|nr:hypothetical protein [Wolbachia endosymbiont of Melophagus ovinus]
MHNLKSAYPEKLKIGAAIMTGDCFFDSVAQGLNELNIKPGYRFTAKSLREDCADYAEQHGEQDSWTYKAVIKDAAIGSYFAALEGPYGPIQNPETKTNMIDEENTFHEYLKDIKNMATGDSSALIWGRPGIEGRMICNKYKVELCVYSIEEDGQKVTVTKITAHDDDPEVFIQDLNLDQLKIDNSKKTVGVVNYMRHFVPLLSKIPSDITESQPVSSEEILGTGEEVPTSDQQEKAVQQERINTATSGTNPLVLQGHMNRGILISHQQEQKTQQEGIQKKLMSNYRKEAIYGTIAVIAAIVFTTSAITAVFTQPIPLAFLAGVALVVACVCVYQLTQSCKNINELKSGLGKDQENSSHTFLEEMGLKMHSLINKATLKI